MTEAEPYPRDAPCSVFRPPCRPAELPCALCSDGMGRRQRGRASRGMQSSFDLWVTAAPDDSPPQPELIAESSLALDSSAANRRSSASLAAAARTARSAGARATRPRAARPRRAAPGRPRGARAATHSRAPARRRARRGSGGRARAALASFAVAAARLPQTASVRMTAGWRPTVASTCEGSPQTGSGRASAAVRRDRTTWRPMNLPWNPFLKLQRSTVRHAVQRRLRHVPGRTEARN